MAGDAEKEKTYRVQLLDGKHSHVDEKGERSTKKAGDKFTVTEAQLNAFGDRFKLLEKAPTELKPAGEPGTGTGTGTGTPGSETK